MVTWGEVRRWNPAPLLEAVSTLNGAYNRVVTCSDDLRGINAPEGWRGDAAEAATKHVTRLIDGLEEYAAEVAAGRRASGDVGDAITGVQNAVGEAEALAETYRFTIADDGSIIDQGLPPHYAFTPQDAETLAAERRTAKAELADRVEQTIRTATDIDDDFCAILDRMLAGRTIDATANDNRTTSLAWAGAAGHAAAALTVPEPPRGAGLTSPMDAAAYWDTLTARQRDLLITTHPEMVGPLDGIPAGYRDQANRIRLDRARDGLLLQRQLLQQRIAATPDEWWNARVLDGLREDLAKVDGKIKGLEGLKDRLETHDNDWMSVLNGKSMYLLDIDTAGPGGAVVAIGNPDTAEDVATYVPGTGSDLATIGGDIDRAESMFDAATEAGSPSTSVITWLDYAAPPDIPAATQGGWADAAVEPLQNFQDGLRVTHEGVPSHNTIAGHSYGTLAIGEAASGRPEGLNVDDIVFVASPGPGVEHAVDLNIDPHHVHSTVADHDPIQLAPLPLDLGHHYGWTADFGTDPTDPDFGGKVFESAPGPSSGNPMFPFTDKAHSMSEYLRQGNPARANMGIIIDGK